MCIQLPRLSADPASAPFIEECEHSPRTQRNIWLQGHPHRHFPLVPGPDTQGEETFNLEAEQTVQTYFLMICLKSLVLFVLLLRNRVYEATFWLTVWVHIFERREKGWCRTPERPIFPYGRTKNAGSGVRETSGSAPVPSLANCTNLDEVLLNLSELQFAWYFKWE